MMTMKRRKENLKPVSGTVRWLRPLIVGKQLGRISITNANGNTTEYDLGAFLDNDGTIHGFGLAKDDDEVYAIDVTPGYGWQCDCPDAQFRGRECKHCKAVRAALKQVGIEVATPKRQQPAPQPVELDDF